MDAYGINGKFIRMSLGCARDDNNDKKSPLARRQTRLEDQTNKTNVSFN